MPVTWQVIIEVAAQAEIAETFDWYEQKSHGLGGDFLRVIAAAEEQLARNPQAQLCQARADLDSIEACHVNQSVFGDRRVDDPVRIGTTRDMPGQ